MSAFWPFWAKVAQTGEFLGPLGVQGIEEKRYLSLGGVSSEATWRVYFVRTGSLVHKYTLRVASEFTPPPRVGYAFLQYLALQGATGIHRFGPLLPKMTKKRSKRGTPCFDQFFSKVPASQTLLSAEI